MIIIVCSMCNKEEKMVVDELLPYRWSKVHRETGDCHDSDNITYESDFYLCPDCLSIVLGKRK